MKIEHCRLQAVRVRDDETVNGTRCAIDAG